MRMKDFQDRASELRGKDHLRMREQRRRGSWFLRFRCDFGNNRINSRASRRLADEK